jgi:iron(III) transport system substrate-binding protein
MKHVGTAVFAGVIWMAAAGAGAAESVSAYCSMSQVDCETITKAFTADTGIEVKFISLSAGENLARIKAERNNPKTAVWIGGSADVYIQAASERLLEPYVAKGADRIDAKYKDPQNFWTPISWAPLGIESNRKLLKELGIGAPASWEELTHPALRGSIVLAHPASSGTGFAVLATLVQAYGEERGFALMRDIAKNVAQFTKSGGAPANMTALGQAAVAVSYVMDIELARSKGYDVEATFPASGTGYGINAVALIANGPKAQAAPARAFVDWILTENGQKAVSKSFWRPVVPGVPNENAIVDTSKVKLMNYDAFWAGENRARLLQKFEAEISSRAQAK